MKQNRKLQAALKYHELGFSVIPVKQDKTPYFAWKDYSMKRPSKNQISEWWEKWPDANIAIITGKVSGITVVDVDSDKGKTAVSEFIAEDLLTPISKTPKGWHYFFSYEPGVRNKTRIIEDCDVRNDGGYVLVPPSENLSGPYSWRDSYKPTDVGFIKMPGMLADILKSSELSQPPENSCNINDKNNRGIKSLTPGMKGPQLSSDVLKNFSQGSRDNTLFYLSRHLLKGGMNPQDAEIFINHMADNCSPPFPRNEAAAKLKSAMKGLRSRDKALSQEVREYVLSSTGVFTSSDIQNCLHVASRNGKKNLSQILRRLHKEGLIEPYGNRNGQYRRLDTTREAIDFLHAETDPFDLWLPFGLDRMVNLMPGNIVLVAGEQNAGKTALLLNIVRMNMHKYDIHYFNSEMGDSELKVRLMNFDGISLADWNFKAWERSDHFADAIEPGKGIVNIIDFLEIYENFYEISARIAEIHNKLDGAIAIIAVQKNPGTDKGLGGDRTLEKPRLALAMSPGKLKIVKAKNWKNKKENPNGKSIGFKLVAGCQFNQAGDWNYEQ